MTRNLPWNLRKVALGHCQPHCSAGCPVGFRAGSVLKGGKTRGVARGPAAASAESTSIFPSPMGWLALPCFVIRQGTASSSPGLFGFLRPAPGGSATRRSSKGTTVPVLDPGSPLWRCIALLHSAPGGSATRLWSAQSLPSICLSGSGATFPQSNWTGRHLLLDSGITGIVEAHWNPLSILSDISASVF
jgi:hypothetical protein